MLLFKIETDAIFIALFLWCKLREQKEVSASNIGSRKKSVSAYPSLAKAGKKINRYRLSALKKIHSGRPLEWAHQPAPAPEARDMNPVGDSLWDGWSTWWRQRRPQRQHCALPQLSLGWILLKWKLYGGRIIIWRSYPGGQPHGTWTSSLYTSYILFCLQ